MSNRVRRRQTSQPAPPGEPRARGHFRPDIQGLRAIAVAAVVAFHAGLPLPGGFVGVDIFFVISGFVITGLLAREHDESGRVRLGRFYVRRFKRLTPALVATALVTSLLAMFVLSPVGPLQDTTLTGAAAIVILANVVIAVTTGDYFAGPAESNALLHTWSLSVEEQFYLAFPALLVLGWALSRRGRRSVAWLPVGLVTAGSFVLAMVGDRLGGLALSPRLVYVAELASGFYSPLTRAWEFAAGAVVWWIHTRCRRSLAMGWVATVLGAGALVASFALITESTPFPGPWTLAPVAGTAALILAPSLSPGGATTLLARRPMVSVGNWSYSIYLWHWPVIVLTKAMLGDGWWIVLAAAASLAPALASYYWIENPFRHNAITGGRRLLGAIVAVALIPAVCCLALFRVTQAGLYSPTVRTFQATLLARHVGDVLGCNNGADVTNLSRCTLNKHQAGAPIYLLGDSHADHISEAVAGAALALGRPTVLLEVNGCPFTTSPSARLSTLCTRLAHERITYLASAPHGVVVLSNQSADESLLTLTQQLIRDGHRVLLIAPTPDLPSWAADECSTLRVLRDACDATASLSRVARSQRSTRARVEQAARVPGAAMLDLSPQICPDGICRARRAGVVVFRDADHLSVAGNKPLVTPLRVAIQQLTQAP